jgi:hypothetical protein
LREILHVTKNERNNQKSLAQAERRTHHDFSAQFEEKGTGFSADIILLTFFEHYQLFLQENSLLCPAATVWQGQVLLAAFGR